ncbi:hypothetical protein [Corynebacterium glutamicum]|nr:hypothetical protein [Corynebacterium glutamicum]
MTQKADFVTSSQKIRTTFFVRMSGQENSPNFSARTQTPEKE